jgi:RNA polymerase sigma factor (sigma-70 family)
MPRNRVGQVEQHLRHLAALTEAQTSDAQLLAAFLAQRDEAAFAALVRRYGSMVLGVCRRLLRHEADAEDAFQAVFLVLVRQAAQVRRQTSLGCWLYRVAYRTALHARTAKQRRRRLEEQVPTATPDPSPETAAMRAELEMLVDQELHALPAKYRDVLVLCDLLGTTKRAAAQQLHCPGGTVSSRLARGRELLRKRLLRRGVTLSVGALAAALALNKAPASVGLIDTTVKAAALVAVGNLAAASGLAPQAAVLLEGVLKSMLLTKLKVTAGLLLLIAVVGGTTSLIACRSLADLQAAPLVQLPVGAQQEKAAQVKKEEKALVDRARLRYDGKDFAYWQDLLRIELKPAVRIEAFKALGAFGVHGYADEVTETTLDIVRYLDQIRMNEDDWAVLEAAKQTLARMGLKALPALTKAYENDNKEERYFVVSTLYHMRNHAEIVPLLLLAAKDKDASIRYQAVMNLSSVHPKSKGLVAALSAALTDENPGTRQQAAGSLGNLGTVAKPALPDLGRAALKDESHAVRHLALKALIALRPEPGTLIPLLATVVEQEKDEGVRALAVQFFQNIKSKDQDYVPALIEVLKSPRRDVRVRRGMIQTLGQIGPAAKEAVPVLLEILGDKESDLETRDLTAQVLKKIQPSTSPPLR